MKIKYVQLESEAFLTDLDYITMSHAERSVYCTLIFYLTSNNGKCEYKPSVLSKLCHLFLALISPALRWACRSLFAFANSLLTRLCLITPLRV